jgi:hypothetical protein
MLVIVKSNRSAHYRPMAPRAPRSRSRSRRAEDKNSIDSRVISLSWLTSDLVSILRKTSVLVFLYLWSTGRSQQAIQSNLRFNRAFPIIAPYQTTVRGHSRGGPFSDRIRDSIGRSRLLPPLTDRPRAFSWRISLPSESAMQSGVPDYCS